MFDRQRPSTDSLLDGSRRGLGRESTLLGKQLASITNTLTNASKRRDAVIQTKASEQASRGATPASSTPVAVKPLVAYPLPSSPTGSAKGEYSTIPAVYFGTGEPGSGHDEVVNTGTSPMRNKESGANSTFT